MWIYFSLKQILAWLEKQNLFFFFFFVHFHLLWSGVFHEYADRVS